LQGAFWTSGIDLNGVGEFEWCTLHYKKAVKEFWGAGMPGSNKGMCAQITMQALGLPALQNAMCSTNMAFICEAMHDKVIFCMALLLVFIDARPKKSESRRIAGE
jgi:hypothetical protein